MHRILPPPAVVAALALLMWGVAQVPGMTLGAWPGQTALAAFAGGLGLILMTGAVWQFRKGGTTVNPMAPDGAARLVREGIYRHTRNPMYLGDLLLLAAWALHLGAPLNALVLPLFVWGLNRLQIEPEERALERRFGTAYRAYCAEVPRWFSWRP